MLNFLLKFDGPQFVTKRLAKTCGFLGVKRIAFLHFTAYRPRSISLVKIYNMKTVARLQHYADEQSNNWDILVQLVVYAYNTQVHRSIGISPFSLVLTQDSLGVTTF